MSILNGNTDYKLQLSKGNVGEIIVKFTPDFPISPSNPVKITWACKNGIDPGSLDVYSGAANVQITKTIKIKFFGQYKIQVSSGRGYSYDFGYLISQTMQSGTTYHDFTANEIASMKYGEAFLYGITGLALGQLVAYTITIQKIATVFSYAIKIGGFYPTVADLFNIAAGSAEAVPGSGWGMRSIFTVSGNSVTVKSQMYVKRSGTSITPIGDEKTKILNPYMYN